LLELFGPSSRQGGFAEPRRRLDDPESLGREPRQHRKEPRTGDEAARPCRHDFGRQEWQPSFAGESAYSSSNRIVV
jgi:hypothetical protein